LITGFGTPSDFNAINAHHADDGGVVEHFIGLQ
jgi:hypothetical protein